MIRFSRLTPFPTSRLVGVVVALALALVACRETGVLSPDREFQVQLTASPVEAAVGEEIEFRVEATGSGLRMLTLRFGDGNSAVEEFEDAAYTELGMTKRHSYQEGGTFQVAAEVHNVIGNTASDALEIIIIESN